MTKYPKLSIVVPTYNRENYLKECLDSIINQNYPNLEIIVTDDNSTDNTEEVIKSYMEKYTFIKYVKNEKYPQGPNGNKNNGLDYATGEIIGIFDDDDTLNDDVLIEMVDKILEGYDVVMGNCITVSDRFDNGQFSGHGLNKDQEFSYKDFLCGKITGEHWIIFKKEKLGDDRFDNNMFGGEGVLIREIVKRSRCYYLHRGVRFYRIHYDSVTHQDKENYDKMLINQEKMIYSALKDLKDLCPNYLSKLYKDASYYAKLNSSYNKAFKYIFKSLFLNIRFDNLVMFILLFFPKNIIPFLSKVRVYLKTGWWRNE